MKRYRLLFCLLAAATILAGCGVPKRQPVQRVEAHEIQSKGGALVLITIREKSAYNLGLGDYSVPVDPAFRPIKVFRMIKGERKVALSFSRKQRRGGAEVLVRLDQPWSPGTKLEVRIEGRMPAVHLESKRQTYSFIIPGAWYADYQSASGQMVEYSANVALPVEARVTSATKGYRIPKARATDATIIYQWTGRLSPGKASRFNISYLPIAQRGGHQ